MSANPARLTFLLYAVPPLQWAAVLLQPARGWSHVLDDTCRQRDCGLVQHSVRLFLPAAPPSPPLPLSAQSEAASDLQAVEALLSRSASALAWPAAINTQDSRQDGLLVILPLHQPQPIAVSEAGEISADGSPGTHTGLSIEVLLSSGWLPAVQVV